MGEMTVVPKAQPLELSAAEQALICGNLANLTDVQRLELYGRVCDSLGLNPLTKPFDYIILNNKMTLYAKRDCTDQLRRLHGVSIRLTDRQTFEGVYVVTAEATDASGRIDTSTGAVSTKGLQGEALCNALMKAETKSKRRVTLSICGLGFLDETEIESLRTTGAATDTANGKQEEDKQDPIVAFQKRINEAGFKGTKSALLAQLMGMEVAAVKALRGAPATALIEQANALGWDAWDTALTALAPVAEAPAPTTAEEVKEKVAA